MHSSLANFSTLLGHVALKNNVYLSFLIFSDIYKTYSVNPISNIVSASSKINWVTD
mgnify:CR=1 FL=1